MNEPRKIGPRWPITEGKLCPDDIVYIDAEEELKRLFCEEFTNDVWCRVAEDTMKLLNEEKTDENEST